MEFVAYTPTTLAEAMSVSRPTVYRWMALARISCRAVRKLYENSGGGI